MTCTVLDGGPRRMLEQEVSKPKNVGRDAGAAGAATSGPIWPMLLLVARADRRQHLRQVITPELIGQAVDCYLTPAAADRLATSMGGPSVMGAAARPTSAANTGCWFATSHLGTGRCPSRPRRRTTSPGSAGLVLRARPVHRPGRR